MKHSLLLWLIWVCLIQKLISISTLLGSNICLDDQKSLLLQLKGNLSYSYNRNTSSVSKLASWNQTLDCCQWVGVQCDNNTGYVTGLDLAGESITNSSDNLRSLFGLQFLQKLNLANNSFNNTVIPSGIRKLAALTHLNLSNAGFGGRVPLEISRLVNLIMLDLSSLSSYLGFPPLRLENPSLAMLIGGLKNLEGLYLNGVLISANGSDWGKALSTSVPNLKFLSLSNCDLSGKIDPSLTKLRSLSEIHLDQNNLDGPVPDFIANFQSLTTLTLSNCKLTETFPERILRLPTLKSLDLSYNGLLKGSLPEFPINNSLQTLVVSYSRFSGQLPNSVGRLVHLQRIELQNCSFVGSIPSSIKQLRQLQCVDLSNNQFSGLMPSFSSAKNLRNLFLNSNKLTGTLSSTKWASLSNLSNLDLSSNSLNGNIPTSLFGLPSLQSVQLYQNEFTGELAEFAIFSPMQILDLSINRLEGSIPKSMFKLQGLKVLKLSYNKFNGSVDLNVIRYLKNLTVLELSFNSLQVITSTGADIPQLRSLRLASCKLRAIPTFLKRQFIMQYLDLSDNQIKGRIPRWIWTIGNSSLSQLNLSCNSFIEWELDFSEIRSLMVLDLHSNKLQGVVPYPPSGIMYLDYSDNNFTSSIPPKIGDFLSYSILFSLSNNNLSGSIPMSLCNLIHLQVLDLSNNQLDGAIPRCLIEMTSTLGVLNLSKNKLRGLTTDTFPENCSLRTLDLNANYLQGSVPISLAYCKQLEVLNLGNNQFSDTFPQWLNKQLRVLVLRSNKFHGSVEYTGDDLMLQIIDLSSNMFGGELHELCLLKLKGMMIEQDRFNTISLQYDIYNSYYYKDTVSVTLKGTEVQLQRILLVFSSIDLSGNNFRGEIPKVIGNLHSLETLNLSHNDFAGSIPSSLKNLTSLESLDLSYNQLSGHIPPQLTQLTFLSVLNLSYNKLEGRIPIGNQFSTFSASSYIHNQGLCGLPLSDNCSNSSSTTHTKTSTIQGKKSSNWLSKLFGSGFGTGAALVIAPAMFWKKGRKWFDKKSDMFVSAILLAFGVCYTWQEEEPQPEDSIKNQLFNITSYHEDIEEGEDEGECGRFCVFCTKLDIQRKRVIHNPRCTCYELPYSSLSFSISK